MTKPNLILYDGLIPGFEWAITSLQLGFEVRHLPDLQDGLADMSLEERSGVFAIFVRSTTKVMEKFIQQFPALQFLATATSGTDHLDKKALDAQGIFWCDAKGSNAKGVADYVVYSLIELYQKQFLFNPGKFAIVGFGCVGRQLYSNVKKLGILPYWIDPFMEQALVTKDEWSRRLDLSEAVEPWLKNTSVLSIHTPLRHEQPWSTAGWLNHERLSALPDGAVVIAAGRGEVLCEEAIVAHSPRLTFILDVWPSEPNISPELLDHVRIATPHIAGHSVLGKLRGTLQVIQEFCQWLGVAAQINEAEFIARFAKAGQIEETWSVEVEERTDCCGILNSVFGHVKRTEPMFDIAYEDHLLRSTLKVVASQQDRQEIFKQLRKKYIQHPEIKWSAF